MSTKNKYSEEELIAGLKAQNKEAFNYLYANYSNALHHVLWGIVKSDEIAEELLHDVFVKIWQKVKSYDSSKGRLYTWMLNVARNSAIDKVRSKAYNKKQKTNSIDDSVSSYEFSGGSSEQYVDHFGMERYFDQLKPEYKKLLQLAYFQGYTQAEIAEKEEIPLGTVKTRIRKALLMLREKLSED